MDLSEGIEPARQSRWATDGGQQSVEAGGLTRRVFLRHVAVSGVAAFLAACGGTPVVREAQPAATSPANGQPRTGGTYRIAGRGDMRSLDPPAAENAEDWWSAGMLLYNMLYFFDKDGKFYADLAAGDPEISDDGMTYTIPLRQGVTFHNGREMVADDVKFSLERQLWPEVYSWGKTYMSNLTGYQDVIDGKTKELAGIRIIDPYTIEIKIDVPQAVFPLLLTMSMNAIIPKQETLDAGADWGVSVVIGTGPFKFVEWRQGEQAVYERNPTYFREGLPYIDRVELSLNVEPAVQMLRWESDELEWVHDIPAAERPRIFGDEAMAALVRRTPAVAVRRLGMHYTTEPFDDVRVRQAVAMAIDKEALALAGGATPLEGFYARAMLQYDPNFKSAHAYDPEGAKQLLAEAGYPDGISGVTLQVNDAILGESVQADLRQIGIEVEIDATARPENRDLVRAGEHALFLYGWAASFPDAYDFVSAWTTCASIETGRNDGMYCNQRIDELLAQAETLPQNDPQRIAAYREIEDIVINQDVAFIGLHNLDSQGLGVAKVHDDFASPIYDGWPYLDAAWIEEE
jgi:ABC-type transport system substrate-binding protein